MQDPELGAAVYGVCGLNSGTCWVADKYYLLLFTHSTNVF